MPKSKLHSKSTKVTVREWESPYFRPKEEWVRISQTRALGICKTGKLKSGRDARLALIEKLAIASEAYLLEWRNHRRVAPSELLEEIENIENATITINQAINKKIEVGSSEQLSPAITDILLREGEVAEIPDKDWLLETFKRIEILGKVLRRAKKKQKRKIGKGETQIPVEPTNHFLSGLSSFYVEDLYGPPGLSQSGPQVRFIYACKEAIVPKLKASFPDNELSSKVVYGRI